TSTCGIRVAPLKHPHHHTNSPSINFLTVFLPHLPCSRLCLPAHNLLIYALLRRRMRQRAAERATTDARLVVLSHLSVVIYLILLCCACLFAHLLLQYPPVCMRIDGPLRPKQ